MIKKLNFLRKLTHFTIKTKNLKMTSRLLTKETINDKLTAMNLSSAIPARVQVDILLDTYMMRPLRVQRKGDSLRVWSRDRHVGVWL